MHFFASTSSNASSSSIQPRHPNSYHQFCIILSNCSVARINFLSIFPVLVNGIASHTSKAPIKTSKHKTVMHNTSHSWVLQIHLGMSHVGSYWEKKQKQMQGKNTISEVQVFNHDFVWWNAIHACLCIVPLQFATLPFLPSPYHKWKLLIIFQHPFFIVGMNRLFKAANTTGSPNKELMPKFSH